MADTTAICKTCEKADQDVSILLGAASTTPRGDVVGRAVRARNSLVSWITHVRALGPGSTTHVALFGNLAPFLAQIFRADQDAQLWTDDAYRMSPFNKDNALACALILHTAKVHVPGSDSAQAARISRLWKG